MRSAKGNAQPGSPVEALLSANDHTLETHIAHAGFWEKLEGAMLYPQDPVSAVHHRHMLESIARGGIDTFGLSSRNNIERRQSSAEGKVMLSGMGARYLKASQKAQEKGEASGVAALHHLRLAHYRAPKHTPKDLVEWFHACHEAGCLKMSVVVGARERIRRIYRDFRSVSHLWAALLILPTEMTRHLGSCQTSRVNLLHLARQIGLRIVALEGTGGHRGPPSSSRPCSIPPMSMDRVTVSLPDFLPLTPQETSWIEGYLPQSRA